MRRFLVATVVILVSVLTSRLAMAQAEQAPTAGAAAARVVGVDGEFAIPLGDFSDAAGLGLGVFARFEQMLAPAWAVTGRLGWVYYFEKSIEAVGVKVSSRVQTVPLLVGGKFYFLPNAFAHVEAGIVLLHTRVETSGIPGQGNVSDTENDLKMMLGLGGGYEFHNIGPGSIVAAAYLQTVSVGDLGDTLQLVFNVGYNFYSF